MSTYVMSDIHGCKAEFDEMLNLIGFNDYDELYIIGDVCDRGPNPIGIYQTIMNHENMHLIFGNHDEWFAKYIDALIMEKLNPGTLRINMDLTRWLHMNGGIKTMDQFLSSSFPECYNLEAFFEHREYYKEITIRDKKYLLVHAGLKEHNYKGINIAEVPKEELLWSHIGLDDNPFQDKIMIVGHMPTLFYGDEYKGKMILRDHIYHIDCGLVYGFSLGCLCLDTMQEFYTKKGLM